MKLEVGMYIRYKGLNYDCPIIQKITKLETPGRCGGKYKVFTNKTNGWFIDSDYIEMEVKGNRIPQPSFNIVDLIEVGDYVNGYYVEEMLDENQLIEFRKYIEDKCQKNGLIISNFTNKKVKEGSNVFLTKINLDKNIKYEQLMAKIEVLEKIMKEIDNEII